MKLPFVGGSYQQDALSFDVQRTVNMYAMIDEVGGAKEPSSLRSTPGLSLFQDIGEGVIRGGFSASNGRSFVVASQDFYEVGLPEIQSLGQVAFDNAPVSMEQNNAGEILIVSGGKGYIFDMRNNSLTEITSPNFPECNTVTYLDGYFIVTKRGTQEYYISGINDGQTWEALEFATAEGEPDNLVAAIASNSNLWLLGETSIEVHQNTGAAVFPFQRIQGAVIQTGCASPYSAIQYDNTLAFLGSDQQGRGVVWKTTGFTVERISTNAIEKKLAGRNLEASYAFSYHEEGHIFYCLQVPELDTTLCYDNSTGLWHERQYLDPVTCQLVQHVASCAFFHDNRLLVGSGHDGRIYHMALEHFDDAGQEIVRERILPHVNDEERIIRHHHFELEMEVGMENEPQAEGRLPQVMLQYSDDGGRTWSYELHRNAGGIGEYKTRVRWARLGSARDRVYRVRYSEKTRCQMNGAYINAN